MHLPTFFEPSKGLQFFLLDETDFEDVKNKKEVTQLEMMMTRKYKTQIPILSEKSLHCYPHQCTGLLIASWLKDSLPHPGHVSTRFIQLSLDCVGNGYGNIWFLNAEA